MDERQRLEIAGRIRDLRERSPWSQAGLAEKLDLSLRGYQKMEERGTTKWERVEELAKIHEVDPRWIWEGTDKPATPDLFGTDGEPPWVAELRERLDENAEALEHIVNYIDAREAQRQAEAASSPPQSEETPANHERRAANGNSD